MKKITCLTAILVGALPLISFASFYSPKIQEFANCAGFNAPLVRLQYQAGEASKARAEADVADKCLDDKIAAALEEAGSAADLRAAIKDVYVKTKSHLSVVFDSKRAEEDAGNAEYQAFMQLKLEAKLAGKTGAP